MIKLNCLIFKPAWTSCCSFLAHTREFEGKIYDRLGYLNSSLQQMRWNQECGFSGAKVVFEIIVYTQFKYEKNRHLKFTNLTLIVRETTITLKKQLAHYGGNIFRLERKANRGYQTTQKLTVLPRTLSL